MLNSLAYYIHYGGAAFVLLFLFCLYIYSFWKVGSLISERLIYKRMTAWTEAKEYLKAILIFDFILFVYFLASGLLLDWVGTYPSIAHINRDSVAFIHADKALFGVYVPFWFHNTANGLREPLLALGMFFIQAYKILWLVLSLLFIIVICVDTKKFYIMCLTFGLSLLLAFPSWKMFPAVSPQQAFLDRIVETPMPPEVQAYLTTYQPNADLNDLQDYIRKIRGNISGGFISVTAMPSMHITWSNLAVYFAVITWPPLALVIIPYHILNVIGTVFTAQHYLVDSLGGLVDATISILLVKLLVRGNPPKFLTLVASSIQTDLRRLWSALKSSVFASRNKKLATAETAE